MIPNSIAAVVSFLLLIAPGFVWEWQRARYIPGTKDSSLTEVSRVVIVSLVATAISAALLLRWVWIPLYSAAQQGGPEAFSSPAASVPYVGATLLTSAMACGLVLIVSVFVWPGKAPIDRVRVWHRAFVGWRDERSDRPHLIVEMDDGTIWRGALMAFDSDPEDSQRSIALGHPLQRKRAGEEKFSKREKQWSVLVLPEGRIKSIQVAYPHKETGQVED